MVLIAGISVILKISMSDFRAVVFHKYSYETGYESQEWQGVRQMETSKHLFRAAWRYPRYKYSFGSFRVRLVSARRAQVLPPSSQHAAVINPRIGSAREGFSKIRRCSFFASLIIPSFFRSSMFETN